MSEPSAPVPRQFEPPTEALHAAGKAYDKATLSDAPVPYLGGMRAALRAAFPIMLKAFLGDEQRQRDPEFMERLRRIVDENADILRLLAEND